MPPGCTGPEPATERVRSPIAYRMAGANWERTAIARLNHRTFTGEIPQHTPTPDGHLVDRFDDENAYLIAVIDQSVVGMMAVRSVRPFSLDGKVHDLDRYLPEHRSLCEIRLLAVEPEHRSGRILLGLMGLLDEFCRARSHDLALISGTVRQLRLYRRLGFQAFGPVVGDPAAPFQPMYLTAAQANARARRFLVAGSERAGADAVDTPPARVDREPLNLLPGPVTVRAEVATAFASPALSHRAATFQQAMEDTRDRLRALTGARHVAIMAGSGTLSNDAIAAQIGLTGRQGLVLANGEFGERLVGQARRHGLDHVVYRVPWGDPFDPEAIRSQLGSMPDRGWLWAVHCETSTGVLNDLPALRRVAERAGVRLVLDCVSSAGQVPVDLDGVWMASATSGKALGAFPGLAIVLASEPFSDGSGLPAVFDLVLNERSGGVPFTLSSNALGALDIALRGMVVPERFATIAETGRWLRGRLESSGVPFVSRTTDAAPGIVTIDVPPTAQSTRIGDRLAADGILVSYQSGYLTQRNWLQLCLFGDERQLTRDRLGPVVDRIAREISSHPGAASS